jgi:hypothetical protein
MTPAQERTFAAPEQARLAEIESRALLGRLVERARVDDGALRIERLDATAPGVVLIAA